MEFTRDLGTESEKFHYLRGLAPLTFGGRGQFKQIVCTYNKQYKCTLIIYEAHSLY